MTPSSPAMLLDPDAARVGEAVHPAQPAAPPPPEPQAPRGKPPRQPLQVLLVGQQQHVPERLPETARLLAPLERKPLLLHLREGVARPEIVKDFGLRHLPLPGKPFAAHRPRPSHTPPARTRASRRPISASLSIRSLPSRLAAPQISPGQCGGP